MSRARVWWCGGGWPSRYRVCISGAGAEVGRQRVPSSRRRAQGWIWATKNAGLHGSGGEGELGRVEGGRGIYCEQMGIRGRQQLEGRGETMGDPQA